MGEAQLIFKARGRLRGMDESGGRPTVMVFEDRVVCQQRQGISSKSQVIRWNQVAQTAVKSVPVKGITLIVETTGGGGINAPGLSREDALKIKRLVDERCDAARAEAAAPTTGAAVSVADEIRKLVELRDMGALTDEEFEAQKAKLLE